MIAMYRTMSQCPTVPKRLQLRNDTAANWASVGNSLVLLKGEFAYETDTGKLKIGDGVTIWNSLPYFSGGSGGLGPSGPQGPQGTGGATGPTGPIAPAIQFDGGILGLTFPYGPVLDCGGIFQSP